jgi:hypothetical protein
MTFFSGLLNNRSSGGLKRQPLKKGFCPVLINQPDSRRGVDSSKPAKPFFRGCKQGGTVHYLKPVLIFSRFSYNKAAVREFVLDAVFFGVDSLVPLVIEKLLEDREVVVITDFPLNFKLFNDRYGDGKCCTVSGLPLSTVFWG